MKTVKLSDFYSYDRDKGGIQELPHKNISDNEGKRM